MTNDLRTYLASMRPSTPRSSKYKNTKVTIGAKTFDSKKEAKRYQELYSLTLGRHIQDLRLQVPFDLIPAQKINGKHHRQVRYIADFVYLENGKQVVEDVKGYRTREYAIKKRLMKLFYDIDIRET